MAPKSIDGGGDKTNEGPAAFAYGLTPQTAVFDQGVLGTAAHATGVTGLSTGGAGVVGSSSDGPGVLGQGNKTGPGVLALAGGRYDMGDVGALEAALPREVAAAAFSELVSANPGLAALLVGKVLVTDLLKGVSAELSGELKADTGAFSGAIAAASAAVSGAIGAHSVELSGDLTASGSLHAADVKLTGADLAEEFDSAEGAALDLGSLVVFDDAARLTTTTAPYDKRVAGVISGAGDVRPGVVLGRRVSHTTRVPLALVGKAYCKVDAGYGPIEVGDLLTSSPTPGHAMRAADPARAHGAVVGKALGSRLSDVGLIPVLIGRA